MKTKTFRAYLLALSAAAIAVSNYIGGHYINFGLNIFFMFFWLVIALSETFQFRTRK